MSLAIWWLYALLQTQSHNAEASEQRMRDTQIRLGEVNFRNQKLEAERTRRRQQLTDWLSTRRYVTKYLGTYGAVVGFIQVRKAPYYLSNSAYEEQEHLGRNSMDVFDPVPLRPAKLPASSVAYEPALMLTDNVSGGVNFEVAILRPTDALKERSYRFLARIDVTLHVMDGLRYDLNIHTAPGTESSGATSLAMNYIIARAKKEKIEALTGQLLPSGSIRNEGHRARLYYFYIEKYGFHHNPVSNAIAKLL